MDLKEIRKIAAKMTLEEKASLCSGKDFWNTKSVDRLGIRSWMMTDGPHGLRKQSASADALGLSRSVPATCFPTGAALGATWNRALIGEIGAALGKESQPEDVGVILGPAINIKRSPLCGRNFEYLSEDPFLAGELAASHISGVQAEGVGASVKHFAVNNQEQLRMTIDAVVDERTLREIYLPAFETAVKRGKPWTVMCAYNRLNGTYCSQNETLLTGILRDEWGFDGLVMTDWGACDDRVAGLAAGQDLEMPNSGPWNDAAIVTAVRSGKLDEKKLDRAVERNLRLHFRVVEQRRPGTRYDAAAHHALARRAAAEGTVLLKNKGGLLPLKKEGRIAFIGAFAKKPRYQGGGSSHMVPTRLDCAWDAAAEASAGKAELVYAAGYDLSDSAPSAPLLAEARSAAASSDVAVVFVGLTDAFESEGFDRRHLRIPESHAALVREVAGTGVRTVVVLSNGAPIEMPWLSAVDAVVEGYLGGQAGGSAAVDVLFGDAEPSGRLAETFPLRLEDNPSYLNFPGGASTVEYREGVFVGYRHYESVEAPVLFPFGHGLSYAKFEYSALALDRERVKDIETLVASVTVMNVGARPGAEVVQLYVGAEESSAVRPRKELKGFEKIFLEPGERRTVVFSLAGRAFSYWDASRGVWRAEGGRYTIYAGSSVRDIRASASVLLEETSAPRREFDRNSTVGEVLALGEFSAFREGFLSTLHAAFGPADPESPLYLMMDALIRELPLRNLAWVGGGLFTPETLQSMLSVANGRESPAHLGVLLPKSLKFESPTSEK